MSMLEAPTCTLTIVNIDPNYQCQNQRSSGLSLHYEQLRQDISLKIRLLARAALIVTWNSVLEDRSISSHYYFIGEGTWLVFVCEADL